MGTETLRTARSNVTGAHSTHWTYSSYVQQEVGSSVTWVPGRTGRTLAVTAAQLVFKHWNLGLNDKLYQEGAKNTSTPLSFSQEWLRNCTTLSLQLGHLRRLCSSRKRRSWKTRYRTTDRKTLKSILIWHVICDLQQLATTPDLLGCSINIGWMNELIIQTEAVLLFWTQGSNVFLPSLPIHHTSYQKSELSLPYLGLPFSYLQRSPAPSLWSVAWEISISIWFSSIHLN